MNNRILVIGATGQLGEPVANQLKNRGFGVRLMVRSVHKATGRFSDGFEVVKGDVTNLKDLENAAAGCFGVHINLSGEVEQIGVEKVARVAAKLALKRITYISGTSVAEENTWVPTIKRKFYAERAIRESGVPYTIFCPAWFMEVLPKYVRGKRAFVFGKQPNPYHFIAAEDYARMVAASYDNNDAVNRRLILHGPEGFLFHDAVKRYCQAIHPEIKTVSTMPYWVASVMAAIKGRPELKLASDFMAAFEKIGEWGDPTDANGLLGAPRVKLDEWLKNKMRHDPGVLSVGPDSLETATS